MNPYIFAQQIRDTLDARLPEGSVVPRHTEREHWYYVPSIGKTFPSVSAMLGILKEQGLSEWKKNRALDYVFEHYKEFTDKNITDHLAQADRRDADIFEGAGDVGQKIHGNRERYFDDWVKTGTRPADAQAYVTADMGIKDLREVSAMAALEKFCIDTSYIPIRSELMLWSEKMGVAGTLDDLCLLTNIIRKGDTSCIHEMIGMRCAKCDYKIVYELTLLDLKSSNQMKGKFAAQIGFYAEMLYERTGLRPKRHLILQVSKKDRTYKIEEFRNMLVIRRGVKSIVKVNALMEMIENQRKDNQKNVITI